MPDMASNELAMTGKYMATIVHRAKSAKDCSKAGATFGISGISSYISLTTHQISLTLFAMLQAEVGTT